MVADFIRMVGNALRPAGDARDARMVTQSHARLRQDLALGAIYFVLSGAAAAFTRVDGGIAMLWFATALLVPRLTMARPQHWLQPLLICAVASVLSTSLFGAGLTAAPFFAAVNLAEAMVGALLLRRHIPDGRYLDTIPRLGMFVLCIGVAMPTLSASFGAINGVLLLDQSYIGTWVAWFTGHGLGTLTAMPLFMLMMRRSTRVRLAELRAGWNDLDRVLVTMAIVVNMLAFMQSELPLLFLPVLPLVLLTLRHGRIGAAFSVLLIAFIGGFCSAKGFGPLSLIDRPTVVRMQFFQVYLATCWLMALPMAAELNRRKFVTRQIRESEALYRLMADRSGDILFNIAVDGSIRYVSPAVSRIAGYEPRRLIGTPSLKLVAKEDRDRIRQLHADAMAQSDETFVYEYQAVTGTGALIWFESHSRAVIDETGAVSGVVSAVRDVSHRKLVEERLAEAAYTDGLTGLNNRRGFDERLATAVDDSGDSRSRHCLVIADIDHFKRVNDTHGHLVGDEVIRKVGAALTAGLREADFVARIGGEEFALLLRDIGADDAASLCERVRIRLEQQPIVVGRVRVPVTISMGVAEIGPLDTLADVQAAADVALYRAKTAGRNQLMIAA